MTSPAGNIIVDGEHTTLSYRRRLLCPLDSQCISTHECQSKLP